MFDDDHETWLTSVHPGQALVYGIIMEQRRLQKLELYMTTK